MDFSIAQRNSHPFTAAVCGVARVAWIDFYLNASGACSLVRAELYGLTPRGITDAFGKAVILEHPANVQLLKDDDAEFINKVAAQLMSKVPALVSDSLMHARGYLAPLASFWRAFGRCAQFLRLAIMFTKNRPRVNRNHPTRDASRGTIDR